MWNEKFIQQPKLPTAALLTGALAMAMGFGLVLFMLSAWMRPHAWIWLVLGALAGVVNRLLARRWYKTVVVPWDQERRATRAEIESLRREDPIE